MATTRRQGAPRAEHVSAEARGGARGAPRRPPDWTIGASTKVEEEGRQQEKKKNKRIMQEKGKRSANQQTK